LIGWWTVGPVGSIVSRLDRDPSDASALAMEGWAEELLDRCRPTKASIAKDSLRHRTRRG